IKNQLTESFKLHESANERHQIHQNVIRNQLTNIFDLHYSTRDHHLELHSQHHQSAEKANESLKTQQTINEQLQNHIKEVEVKLNQSAHEIHQFRESIDAIAKLYQIQIE